MAARSFIGKMGFTLLELLVVIAIIMLLGGLLFPAFTAARENGRKTKAKADVRQLDMAFKAVLMDYRTWTDAQVPGSIKTAAGGPVGSAVVNYLNATDIANNSKKVVYMEFDTKSLDAGNNFIDPWKQAFRVALGDSSVAPGGTTLYRQVAAWSLGKKGASAVYADFIKSWE
jgi:prepilin-type N-terminal cleavage/methylation domain-containing protein